MKVALQFARRYPERTSMQPLYRVLTQKRASGSVDIVVKFSPTLRMLPAFERERAIEEASTQAYQRVLEAFEPQREAVA